MSSNVIFGSVANRLAPSSVAPAVGAVAFGIALTAAAAQFTAPLPGTAVPFVLTPMAVLLVGAAIGSRLGMFAQVGYLAAGIIGLSVFAPSATLPPGAARILGPTGGYLMAYPIAAFVTGLLAERGWDRKYSTSVLAMCVGLAVIYLGGTAWYTLTVTHSISVTFATSVVPFAGFDLAKVLVAAAILPAAWRRLSNVA